jgi:hypothetical protein
VVLSHCLGESHDKTSYSAYYNSELRLFGGGAADAHCGACDSAACASTDSCGSGADDYTECSYSHGPSSGSKHQYSAGESKHDAADQSNWAADADYHQGGRGGNRERSSANKQCRDSDTDWGSADSDAADACTGQRSARESRAAFCPSPAMRERLGRDSGE